MTTWALADDLSAGSTETLDVDGKTYPLPSVVEAEDGSRLLLLGEREVRVSAWESALAAGAGMLVLVDDDGVWVSGAERFAQTRVERDGSFLLESWLPWEADDLPSLTGMVLTAVATAEVKKTPGDFVSLHSHLETSLLDGWSTPKELLRAVIAAGHDALAITDHGVVIGHPDFQAECDKAGVKAVLGCLLAGQRLMTDRGAVPIESIEVGNQVLTHRGRFRPVVRTMTRRYQGDLYTLRCGHMGATELTVTDEHPVLVANNRGVRRWVRADQLQGGYRSQTKGIRAWNEYVCVPKLAAGIVQTVDAAKLMTERGLYPHDGLVQAPGASLIPLQRHREVSELVRAGATYAQVAGLFETPIGSVGRIVRNESTPITWRFPANIEIDENFAYFLGLATAEGCFSGAGRGQVSLTFNLATEKDTLAAWVSNYLLEWGVKTTRYERPDRNTVDVYFCHLPLATVLANLIGSTQPNRIVPRIIFESPFEVRQSFLQGMVDGDGKHASNGERSVKISSESLAWGLRTLLADLGFYSKVVQGENDGHAFWMISYKPNRKWSRTWDDDEYVYLPLHRVDRQERADTAVFNCEVAEDNSYVGDFALHNCEAYFTPDRSRRSTTWTETDENGVEVVRNDSAEVRAQTRHMCLWAMDQVGLENLWAISTEGQISGYYYNPRIDWDTLTRLNEGIIASSGCLGGPLSKALSAGNEEEARQLLARFLEIFPDRYYIEIHVNHLPEQMEVNRQLVRLAREYDVPMIAAVDHHYTDADEFGCHAAWMASRTNNSLAQETGMFGGGESYHYRTSDEVRAALAYLGDDVVAESMANTVTLAARCNARVEGKTRKPVYSRDPGPQWTMSEDVRKFCLDLGIDPDTMSSNAVRMDVETLVRLCWSNWQRKVVGKKAGEEVYRTRFGSQEMRLIISLELCGYYLVTSDLVRWAKGQGMLTGPGRGSGGASLVAYLCDIIEVDAVQYALPFERFLTAERDELPDFDLDFPKSTRDRIHAYASQRWGQDHVVRVGTHSRLRVKDAVNVARRVLTGTLDYEVDFSVYTRFTQIAEAYEATLSGITPKWEDLWREHAEELEPLRQAAPDVFGLAEMMVDRMKGWGKHPSGLVISTDEPLTNLPLRRDENGMPVTQFDFRQLAKLGYLKYDALFLKTLDMLQAVIDSVFARTGRRIDPYAWRDAEFEDPQVWETLREGHTLGAFQVETPAGTRLTRRVKPESIDHLAAIMALNRPGPLKSGLAEKYLRRRHGEEAVTYPDPRLEQTLGDTFGVVIYQEQIMWIACILANYSLGEADSKVRKVLGKKLVDEIGPLGEEFMARAIANDTDPQAVAELWESLKKFATYSFGRSHSYCYAILCYWAVWLKTHYPLDFQVSVLTQVSNDPTKAERIGEYIDEARWMGYGVAGPDVNESGPGFASNGLTVRFGLGAVKGVGLPTAEAIVAGQPYESYEDFVARMVTPKGSKANAGHVRALTHIGALDCLIPNRRGLELALEAEKNGDTRRCVNYNADAVTPQGLPCNFDWANEVPVKGVTAIERGRKPNKYLELKPVPKKCTAACRHYQAPPPPDPELEDSYTDAEIRDIELELLGAWVSSSPFDVIPPAELAEAARPSEIEFGPSGEYVTVGVVIEVGTAYTSAGKIYARLELRGIDGTIKMVCWEETYKAHREDMAPGTLVVVALRKDDRGCKLTALKRFAEIEPPF
jgi:DNA polymerase III subunit alpha